MGIMTYREDLAERVVGVIAEANGGALPVEPEELESVFPRFGARVVWLPREILPEPLLRGSVAYIPDSRPGGRRLVGHLAHELAEVVLRWEGCRQYQGPGWSADSHRVADMVERLLIDAAAAGAERGH